MKRILLIVLIAAYVNGLFAQGQVIWQNKAGGDLGDTTEIYRLPQHESMVFEALIKNVSPTDHKVLLKRTIVSYIETTSGNEDPTDQLCYGTDCQFGDKNKKVIITKSELQKADSVVDISDPIEFIHFIPNENVGTCLLKYYIMTEKTGDTTMQDSIVVKYIVEPYKRVDLRFSIDMTGAANFDPATQTAYVQVYDASVGGLVVKKMKRSGSTSIFNLGSTGHYYVDDSKSYTYKYFKGTSSNGVYDTIGEPSGIRASFQVAMEDQISFNDKWGNTTSISTEARLLAQVYPNPFANNLVIDNLQNTLNVVLTNILGQVVFSSSVVDTKIELDASMLNAGIYFVKITDQNNQVKVERVIKK